MKLDNLFLLGLLATTIVGCVYAAIDNAKNGRPIAQIGGSSHTSDLMTEAVASGLVR